MENKIMVITGATNGLGKEAARHLAARGHSLILVGRDEAKGRSLVTELLGIGAGEARRSGGTPPFFRFYAADLSVKADILALGKRILSDHPQIHVLLNNAGGYFETFRESPDGREYTWALNHLGYVQLTEVLLPALKAAGKSRIVNVASYAHMGGRTRWDDLEGRKKYSGWGAYSQSKLANILFTSALARRLEGTGVETWSLHPGFVDTGFGNNNSQTLMGRIFKFIKRWAVTPEEGARTSVFLCTADNPGAPSGAYFADCKPARPSSRARNVQDQERLWRISREALGLEAW